MRDDWVEQDAWDDGYSHGYDDAEQRIADLEAQVRQLETALADVEPLVLPMELIAEVCCDMGQCYATARGPKRQKGTGTGEDVLAAIRAAVANAKGGEK